MRASHRLLILFGAALLILTAGFGLRDPWPPNEPEYALAAAEILGSGRWLAPTLAGELFVEEGPLYLWILAIFQWIFGMRAGFLLPSLLAGIGILWMVSDLARRLWGDAAGFWAGGAMLGCVQFALHAHGAGGDVVQCLFVVCGLYGLSRHLLLGPSRRHFLFACAACGLGLLINISGLLPLLLAVPWLWAARRGWVPERLKQPPGLIAGLLVLVAIPAAWLAMLFGSGSEAVAAYRLALPEVWPLGRGPTSWSDLYPFWYYILQVAPWACFPLVLALPWVRYGWGDGLRARDPALLCFIVWAGAVLLLISVSQAKRAADFLPVIPALALACGPHLGGALQRRNCRLALWIGMMAVLLALLFSMLGVYGVTPDAEPAVTSLSDGSPFWLNLLNPGRLALLLEINSVHPVVVPLVIVASAAGLAGLLSAGSRRAPAVTGCIIVLFWALLGWGSFSLLNDGRSGRTITGAARAALTQDTELAMADWRAQQMLHIDRPATHFGRRRTDRRQEILDASAWLGQAPNRVLLAPEEYRDWCFRGDSGVRLGYAHRRYWYLLGAEALRPECRLETAPQRVVRFPGWR